MNEFDACHLSPVTGKTKCRLHLEKEEAEPEARVDFTVMTRSRSALLKEVLTTDSGFSKKESITVRKDKFKTAGMIYLIRPYGITVGHMEMIQGGMTNFMNPATLRACTIQGT